MTDPAVGNGSPDRFDAAAVARVRGHLEALAPVDEREASSRDRFLAELDRLDRPFDERADPVHVTASCVVVGHRGTVLHLHRRLGRWLQPGGHIDPGEAPEDAAVREAREETGLAVTHPAGGPRLIHVDVHEAALGHVHLDLRYLLVGPDEDPTPLPGESPEARWCSWAEAEAMADEALAGALRVARASPEAGASSGPDEVGR